MILAPWTKVLVAHRRLFEHDHNRYFVGTVEGYEEGIARVTGYTWLRDGYSGEFRRKADERTKLFALVSGTVILCSRVRSTSRPSRSGRRRPTSSSSSATSAWT